ncbi:TPA: hypothetical protein N0F65_003993 [Lagenidium giganteum]|uniref:CCHC-type domain-containing protein n=1 Tax=Lagenidium giganteum TaxID=4803 RepID=A0AAV2YVX2_9STRA|nr:TPA: hypothetical protein N0F65_003993 [Lagenidium giganteum]
MLLSMQREINALRDQLSQARAPSVNDVSMQSVPPSPKKPKMKDVRCTTFKGHEVYTSLGAGFENFLSEFEHAIHTERLVNGKASRHFHKKNSEWQRLHYGENMPYTQVKKVTLSEFGCKLSQLELSSKLQCVKREGDSWNDYLEYIKFIEGLMEGDQTKLVLEVFCRNACPELAPTLLSNINENNADYIEEVDKAKSLLYKLRGDGRNVGGKRSRHPHHKHDNKGMIPQQPFRHHDKHPRGHGNEKPQEGDAMNTQGARTLKCSACNEPGHKMSSCPFVEKAKQLAKNGPANFANGCDDDHSDDENATQDTIEDVWWSGAGKLATSRHTCQVGPEPRRVPESGPIGRSNGRIRAGCGSETRANE